jgi:hypothetical protein
MLIGILALEQLKKDWQSLKRIYDRKQRRKRADEQGQNLSHVSSNANLIVSNRLHDICAGYRQDRLSASEVSLPPTLCFFFLIGIFA